MDMRIAAGMDVAHAAVDDCGTFQNLDVLECHQVARLSLLDADPCPPLHQDREPADLELGPGADQQVCPADLGDQARPGADVMGILAAVCRGVHCDITAAHFLGKRSPLGLTGEYPHLRRGRKCGEGCRRQAARRQGACQGSLHGTLRQNVWAACAPRLMMYWNRIWSSGSPSSTSSRLYCSRMRLNSLLVQSAMTA